MKATREYLFLLFKSSFIVMLLACTPSEKSAATTAGQNINVSPSSATTVLAKAKEEKDPFSALFDNIANSITKQTNKIGDWFNDLGKQITTLTNQISDWFIDLFNKVRTFILGIDPDAVAKTIVAEVSNEDNCKDLPVKLDIIMAVITDSEALQSLGLPKEFYDYAGIVRFSNLGIVGIDPTKATVEDLYYYKVKTVKPLGGMANLANSYFKIPFAVGSAIANACVDATEFYMAKRDEIEQLHARIHEDLSSHDDEANIQFQLPESANGHLEAVADVIEETIQNFNTAMIQVPSEAIHAYNNGLAYYQNQDYQHSYEQYQQAYTILSTQEVENE